MAIKSDTTKQEPTRVKITQQSPSNSVEYSKPNPHLPHEIIIEILLRLPVKSLLQCRSVSKLWCSVISTPQFAKTHLNVSTMNNEYVHHGLVLRSTNPKLDLSSCSLYSVMYERYINAVEHDCLLKYPYHYFSIVGYSNGLLCLAIDDDTLLLWNPSTGQSRRLPDWCTFCTFSGFFTYGFGYDESMDDYVVVVIFCFNVHWYSFSTEVKVYRSRTDSWRKIQDFPYGNPSHDSGKFANGAFHWVASNYIRSSSPYSGSIIAFDLSNETYREVLQPSYGEGEYDLKLGVLGELLCLLHNYGGTRAHLWVMKEYGVRESWTKLVTFQHRIDSGIKEYSIPLCIAKNGEVLMKHGSYLTLYNPKDSSFDDPQLHNFVPCLEACAYVESLVSPNIHAGPERQ